MDDLYRAGHPFRWVRRKHDTDTYWQPAQVDPHSGVYLIGNDYPLPPERFYIGPPLTGEPPE